MQGIKPQNKEICMKKRDIIDVHAHILPGIDDGARDMAESCLLLEQAVRQGITAVIATPHNTKRAEPAEIRRLVQEIRDAFCSSHPGFAVYEGQEIYFHEKMADRLRAGELLTLAGSRCVLVEFDPGVSYRSLYRGIRMLISAGYQPVLAHMERYTCLFREENLADLTGSGCLMQMNYESLGGNPLAGRIRWCRRQVLAGNISFLGTDMHRTDYRSPDIGKPMNWLRKNIEESCLDEITYKNALHMINKEGTH